MNRDATNQGNASDDTNLTDEEKKLREDLGDTSQEDMSTDEY
jgi:hypothetical protein